MSRPAQSVEARVEARAKDLWRKYGLTVEQYDQQFAHQDGLCMYCHKPGGDMAAGPRDPRRTMVPDEEHDPPFRFRGLAHPKCNQLAGIYERGWRNPPAFEDGGVEHVISTDRVAARVQREDMARTRKARLAGKTPTEPGERTSYEAADWRGNGRVAVPVEDDDQVESPGLARIRDMTRPNVVDQATAEVQPEGYGMSYADKMRALRGEEPLYADKVKAALEATERARKPAAKARPPEPPPMTDAQRDYLTRLTGELLEPFEYGLTKAEAGQRIEELRRRVESKRLRENPIRYGRKKLMRRLEKDGKRVLDNRRRG